LLSTHPQSKPCGSCDQGAVGWHALNQDVLENIFANLTLVQLARVAPTCREFRTIFHTRREPLTAQLLKAGCNSYGQSVFNAVAMCILRFTAGLDVYTGLPVSRSASWGPHGAPSGPRGPDVRGGNPHEQVMCIEHTGRLSRIEDWPPKGKVDVTWTHGTELRFLFVFPAGGTTVPPFWCPLLAMRVTPMGYARRAYKLEVVANQHCGDILGAILAVCMEMEREIVACPGESATPRVESIQYRLPLWAYNSPAEHDCLVATVVPLVRMIDTWRTEIVNDEPTTFVRWTLTGTRTRDPRDMRAAMWESALTMRGFLAWLLGVIITWVSGIFLGL
jgi:hypothetical protein